MRRIIYLFVISVLCISYACTDDSNEDLSGNGTIAIRILKTTFTDTTPASYNCVVTLVNESGTEVLKNKILPLNKLGKNYESDSLSYPSGNYKISRLTIYNSSWECIYATPVKGSKKATSGLNLPYELELNPGFKLKLTPNLLTTQEISPLDFGYSSFHYNASEAFSFKVVGYEAIINDNYFYTTPKLVIKADSFLYQRTLPDSAISIPLPSISKSLSLTFTKSGYDTVKLTYSVDSLKKYTSTALKVYLNRK